MNQELWVGVQPSVFNNPCRWFWCPLKSETHCHKGWGHRVKKPARITISWKTIRRGYRVQCLRGWWSLLIVHVNVGNFRWSELSCYITPRMAPIWFYCLVKHKEASHYCQTKPLWSVWCFQALKFIDYKTEVPAIASWNQNMGLFWLDSVTEKRAMCTILGS